MKEAPYLVRDRDRHGNVRWYVRKPGRPKVRIRAEENSDTFWREYAAALKDGAPGKGAAGSLSWLCQKYYASAEFKRLQGRTKIVRQAILNRFCDHVGKDGVKSGDRPYREMRPRHIRQRRDLMADTPESANMMVKSLRQVFRFAVEIELAESNPAAAVPYIITGSAGFHTWSVEEVLQYQERHPVGTKARLALDILLYTGARRSDAVTFGHQMVRDGWLHWTEAKGQAKLRKERSIPLLPELAASLKAAPTGDMIWLVTSFNKPFTTNGFGNRFKKWCVEAGLPGCSAHGLRKAGATIAAENGASEHHLMAIFGWENPRTGAIYTKTVNRRKLVADAMHLISVSHSAEKVSHRPGKAQKS